MGKVLRAVLVASISALAVSALLRLYVPPQDTDRQLTYLRQTLDAGAGEGAQTLFPEGYFFSHVLYGLAWVDEGKRGGDRDRAVREAGWALSRLDGPEGTAPFADSLAPRYGIFYAGWTNWLRGGLLSMRDDPEQRTRFEATSREIAAAFDASPSPFLQAYPGQSWPVDSTVAIASLRLHDTLATPAYAGTVQRWLDAAKQRLDPATGLLPHVTDPGTGRPLQGARASSQSMILRFLPEVDAGFARQQYLKFRDQFVDRPLHLGPAVREYPKGVDGAGDVDSGPLPLGISFSATVVTIGAARVNGDDGLADALSSYGEVAGVPITTWHTKRYAFGALPIGDSFLVWARTAPSAATPIDGGTGPLWKAPLTLILLVLAGVPWWRNPKRRKQQRDGAEVGGVVEPVVPERL
ncbi:hypothetical protein ACQP00_13090 [Dactylosporangium sp. CS-047395]|uniref:hypothetical protein n=1 Tax=Dactylosporangium sp. CS-047395 TaxID=3239936 RepID=UPI003D8A70F7